MQEEILGCGREWQELRSPQRRRQLKWVKHLLPTVFVLRLLIFQE